MDLFTLYGTIAINATVANQTIDGTMEKVGQLTGTLQIVGEQAEKSVGKKSKFSAATVWAGNMFTKLTTGAVDLGKKLYGIGIGYNAGVETATTHLTTLLKGDAEAANELVASLEKLATKTPLGTAGLVSNAKELLGYGVKLEDILPTLEMLGNFAMGDQTKLDGIVRAYGQIFSQGFLLAQDANQLVNQDVPIFQILSEHVGGRYEGLTRKAMIGDKDNPVMFEDLHAAMVAASSEGGKFFNAMFNTLDTYQGQLDKFGEEGEQSIGKLTKPLFEVLKSDVLPKLSESLSTFNTWIDENKETITEFSKAIGGLVAGGFDKLLEVFKWMTENGDAVGNALAVIATGMAIGAIAAHPYATAIAAIAAGLAWLTNEEGKRKMNQDHFFDGHDQEALEALQEWVEAKRALKEADDTYRMNVTDEEYYALVDAADAAAQKVNALDGELMGLYESWRTNQENGLEYLDVPLKIKDGTENEFQAEINNMTLEGVVKFVADTSGLSPEVYSIAKGESIGVKPNAEGAIFSKPTIFNTRLGYQMVGEAGAEAVAPITKLQQYVSDAVRGTVGGMSFNVVLDSGVLVGQLAPKMDAQLGTLASRKGRGN